MRLGALTRRVVVLLGTALALALLSVAPLPEAGADSASAPLPATAASSAPTPRPPLPSAGASSAATPHRVVALGDSVPSGAVCGCQPFPALYASLLGARTGVPVTVANHGVNGLTTAGLLAQLGQSSVADDVRRADVVLVTIGANDFADHHDQVEGGTCGAASGADCVGDELDSLRSTLTAVLAHVRDLRRGQPTTVLVTGYWNVFEDGDVARRLAGESGVQASIELTRRVNSVIQAVSTAAGARYVDVFAPFQSRGREITSYLADDGDHPDEAGHRLLATTLLAAGLPRAAWS